MPLHSPEYVRIKREMGSDIQTVREQYPIFTIVYLVLFVFLTLLGWWMLGIWGSLIFLTAFITSLLYEYM